MSKNVIVTGGAGYIGSMTAKVLKEKGYNPVSVDNLQTGFKELVKFGPFEEADIGDVNAMEAIFEKYKPIAVIHFAASLLVEESTKIPLVYYKNNVAATLNLLQVMLEQKINNIVFSSTAALFGNPDSDLIKEDNPINPINPYGKSKAMVEAILGDLDSSYGLKFTNLRYFNVVGADPELTVGECHTPGTHLFPLIFYRANKGKEVLIYGDDYNTKDGTCIRDYVHVKDLAVAHVLAMEKLLENGQSVKINLGNGKGFSVKEIVSAAKKVTGIDFKVQVTARRAGDPARLVSDISFSRKYLGWQPQFVNVESSLEHAWLWFKKFHKID